MRTATEASTTRVPARSLAQRGGVPTDVLTEPPLLEMTFATPRSGVLVVQVSGELDLASAPELDARLQHELRERRPHLLILDLARLRFLGLHGIAVFERLRGRASASRIDLSLVALSPAGARALEFAGVLSRFDRYPDVATALVAAAPVAGTPGAPR